MYPLLLSIVATTAFAWTFIRQKFTILTMHNLPDALGAIITFTSIILGFVGVLLTSIVSIKKESEFVQYFFDNADKKYFCSVVSGNIFSGALLALVSVFMYFAESSNLIGLSLQFAWIFLIFYFVLTTFRLMRWLLTLLCCSNDKKPSAECNVKISEEKRTRLEDKHKK